MALAKRSLIIAIVLFISGFIWLGIFPPNASRIFLNHRRAVGSIQVLILAEHNYEQRNPDAGFACNLGDLSEHGPEPSSTVALDDRVLTSGTKGGYHFNIGCPQNGNQKARAYTITALPVEPGHTGTYALCTDQRGEIWYSESGSDSDCLATQKPVEKKYR